MLAALKDRDDICLAFDGKPPDMADSCIMPDLKNGEQQWLAIEQPQKSYQMNGYDDAQNMHRVDWVELYFGSGQDMSVSRKKYVLEQSVWN